MSQVINSPDQVPNWNAWDKRVSKIVLGPSPRASGEDGKPLKLASLPDDLAERFPKLTHLYLWRIEGLRTLPALPADLECLDVRGCGDLEGLPELPKTLETLDIGECVKLQRLPTKAPTA